MWPWCLEQVNVHMRQIVMAILDRLHTLIIEGLDTQDKAIFEAGDAFSVILGQI